MKHNVLQIHMYLQVTKIEISNYYWNLLIYHQLDPTE